MGIAVKVLIGLVLLLPMTAYVVHGLVAAAEEPRQHDPIIVEQPTKTPDHPRQSPSAKPTKKADHDKKDDHGGGKGSGNDDGPVVVHPSPSVLDDDGDVFDDHGGLDNSGKGSSGGGGDSSGKGSGDG